MESGSGQCHFTQQLHQISRGENAITAATFSTNANWPTDNPAEIQHLNVPSLRGALQDLKLDFIVAMAVLDGDNSAWFLKKEKPK